jgi:hypothetical protein
MYYAWSNIYTIIMCFQNHSLDFKPKLRPIIMTNS